jgi:hypothetical protein
LKISGLLPFAEKTTGKAESQGNLLVRRFEARLNTWMSGLDDAYR